MSIYEGATGYGMVIYSNQPHWQGYVVNAQTVDLGHELIKQARATFIHTGEGSNIPMELSLTSTTLEPCPYVNEEDQAIFGALTGSFASCSAQHLPALAGVAAAAISILTCRNYFTIRARKVGQGVRTTFEAADEVALKMANILTGKSVVETFVAMCQRDPEVLVHQETLRREMNLPLH